MVSIPIQTFKYYVFIMAIVALTIIIFISDPLTAAYSQPPAFKSNVEALPRALPFKVAFISDYEGLSVKGFEFLPETMGSKTYYHGIQVFIKIGDDISENIRYRVSVNIIGQGGFVWKYDSDPLVTATSNTINTVIIDFDCNRIACPTPDEILEVKIELNYLGS